jgi:broad specificity phosphatase PhoE
MQILLFRHGEREDQRLENPGLSGRGRAQDEKIPDQARAGRLPAPHRIWVSPKQRAIETLTPLAQAFQINLQVMPELNERQSEESTAQFGQRVKRFFNQFDAHCTQSGVLYLCSHLDWIEEAMIASPSQEDLLSPLYQSWATAQFLEFDVHDGLWFVRQSGRIDT